MEKIPEGYHSITPTLTLKDSAAAIEFYKKAFMAEVLDYMPHPGGKGVMHASVKIGNSMVMMGDEMQGEKCAKSAETLGSSPVGLYLYVEDVDATFNRAIKAGGKIIMPVTEMFWGDRVGTLQDPFGYSWMVGTHTRDLTQAEISKGAEAFFAQMKGR